MADMPNTSGSALRGALDPVEAARIVLANRAAPGPSTSVRERGDAIPLLEETLTVSKLRRSKGIVRVSTRVETVQESVEAELDRYRVEVTRVPVGRVVAEAPVARAEGDTTIIPVVEERSVVVKQLFLVEEIRIRHVLERTTVSELVTLRRQRAVVERLGPECDDDPRRTGEDRAPFAPAPD